MGGSQEFLAFVRGQLAGLPHLTLRSMFGGTGLYSDGVFFGIVSGDTLFLRVDAAERAAALAAGRAPFRPYPGRALLSRSYFTVPAEVLEDAQQLTQWAQHAVAARAARRR